VILGITCVVHSLPSPLSSSPLSSLPPSPWSSSSSSEEITNSALEGFLNFPFEAFFVACRLALDLLAFVPTFSLSALFRFPRITPASDLFFLGLPTTSPFFSRALIDAACASSSPWVSQTHLHAPVFHASRSIRMSMILVMSDGLTNISRGQPTTLTPCSSTITRS
jgi:hypothetical protein